MICLIGALGAVSIASANPRRGSTGHGRWITRPASVRAGKSCKNSNLVPRAANLALVRSAVLCLVNHQRALHGLARVRPSARLASAAQRHSTDMVHAAFFNHLGSAGDTPLDRLRASGYLHSGRRFTIGENIAWEAAPRGTAAALVADWMASPDHRANILDPSFRNTGIGLVAAPPTSFTGGNRGTTTTEDFGRIS